MSLIGRWTNLIYKVATGSWKTKLLIAPIVGASYLGLIVGFILLSRAADRVLKLPTVFYHLASTIIGYFLILLGFILMFISVVYFLRVRGSPVPFSPPRKLVVIGPYKYARNPMVTGIFIQLFGIGIVLGSLALLLIFTPLFTIMNVWELKMIEEPELEKRFGKAYIQYKKMVPMFLPFTKRQKHSQKINR